MYFYSLDHLKLNITILNPSLKVVHLLLDPFQLSQDPVDLVVNANQLLVHLFVCLALADCVGLCAG